MSSDAGVLNTIPFCSPNQNCHESWHAKIHGERIPGMFKGSTEHVMHVALKQLIEMDAAMIPSTLQFHVPAVPPKMWEGIPEYVDKDEPRILQVMEGGHDEKHPVYYILDRESVIKKLTLLHVNALKDLLRVTKSKLSAI